MPSRLMLSTTYTVHGAVTWKDPSRIGGRYPRDDKTSPEPSQYFPPISQSISTTKLLSIIKSRKS
jgi:hypothetical protein